MLKLLLLCDYSRQPDRRLLRGVVKYANEHGGWDFISVNPSLRYSKEKAEEIICRASESKVDAMFGNWPGIIPEKARELKIPIVLKKHSNYPLDFPILCARNKKIGEIAADYFIVQHYDSYAFFGLAGVVWSKERMDGFENRVKYHGKFYSHLISEAEYSDKEVSDWLRNLPKPIALYACNDSCAQFITETCRRIEIDVPGEIAVMGTDNDEFLCNISYPEITSIKLDYEKQGYELAQKIESMVRNKEIKPYCIPLEPVGIVERGSTQRYRITDPYVKMVVERMERCFTENISVRDLIEDIPLSRRSIELRFKKDMHPYSMLQFLNMLRLRHFLKLLQDKSIPISEVAELSGFDEQYKVYHLFKKQYGCTPMEYRKKYVE